MLNKIKKLSNSCFIIVSKSGRTIETIINLGVIFPKKIIKNKLPFDLLSIELRDGIQNLSKITGQELTEEILDNIFSKFCIGK